MIHEYVNKLIDNIPNSIQKSSETMTLDLILDGGAFNGSYLIGALYFLKEMENRNYVKIRRISGCSIGSMAGFAYFINHLDLINSLSEVAMNEFKMKHSLEFIKNIKLYTDNKIPADICTTINERLYISYYNIDKGKKVVKSSYKSIDQLINTITKSCFVPYLIDGNIMYENKYIDGISPYIFTKEPNVKILHLDLFGLDKLSNMLNIKNEKTPTHRVLSGLLEMHNFFIKQTNTSMCSYVNDWSLTTKSFYQLKLWLEKIIIVIIYGLIYIEKYVKPYLHDTIAYKCLCLIFKDILLILFEEYCI